MQARGHEARVAGASMLSLSCRQERAGRSFAQHSCRGGSLEHEQSTTDAHLDTVLKLRACDVEQAFDTEDVHNISTLPQQSVHPAPESF